MEKSQYLAIASIAVAATIAVFVFQGFTIFGEVISSVYEDFYVQDLSENHPEILDAAITVDEATLNQAPKLKEIINEAYKRKDNNVGGAGRSYSTQISVFDYNSIKAISEKNDLSAERFKQDDGLVVKYNGLYYGISIIRR